MPHCFFQNVDILLGPVDRVDIEIEIFLLIDQQRLVRVGQCRRVGDVRVFHVILDRHVADRGDLDRIAGLADLAFVGSGTYIRLSVYKRFFKSGQQSCRPYSWDK